MAGHGGFRARPPPALSPAERRSRDTGLRSPRFHTRTDTFRTRRAALLVHLG
ncbi:hypothetical protein EVAR_83837_1, partial [Eumeta japonica]